MLERFLRSSHSMPSTFASQASLSGTQRIRRLVCTFSSSLSALRTSRAVSISSSVTTSVLDAELLVWLMSLVHHKSKVRWCIRYTTCAPSPCIVRCMVTAKTQYNLTNAREYFEEHLCVGDYYDEGQRVAGEWIGMGAERLGLSGKVRADDFLRLCENQHPGTGETLTQRLNTTRMEDGENAANRRIFYDFTFSPPKSVSLAGFLGKDDRILGAHARAVKSALQEFEAFAATRIRTGGAQSDR